MNGKSNKYCLADYSKGVYMMKYPDVFIKDYDFFP